MTSHEKAWLRLHLTPGLGRSGLLRLLQAFGSPGAILAADPSSWSEQAGIRSSLARDVPAASNPIVAEAQSRMEQVGARIVAFDDDDYPPLLKAIHDPPALLYARGKLPEAEALAVVGARRATAAGKRLTEEICAEVGSRRITVVSGLARGIDTAAHRGALVGGGGTVAVLGCGIDRVYPPENARLFHHILEQGAIVSEYPPGTPPLAGHFPGRNRIISGMCRGVLVVEAAEGSGSLITADFALEQGREVFAVPGAVFAATAEGVNGLLKEGARLVTEAADILEVLWPEVPSGAARRHEETLASSLSGSALALFQHLGQEPLHIDELVQKTGLTPMEVSVILLTLELQGGAEQLPGMRYVRRKP
jgi:DNA processing protein